MSYLNDFFAEEASYGWQGGPEFNTRIVDQLNNWREARNAEWASARHRFQVPFQNIDRDVYAAIKRMHLVARGRLHAFKFIDVLDSQADDEPLGEPDGVQTVFQLGKLSVIDGVPYRRHCHVILKAAITVNGVATAVTLDADRGMVSFAAAPAAGAQLRWSGRFGLWVRFDQDYLPFSLDNLDALNGSVTLLELPPPPTS